MADNILQSNMVAKIVVSGNHRQKITENAFGFVPFTRLVSGNFNGLAAGVYLPPGGVA